METMLQIQSTPNPNALKFVLNLTVINQGNITYKNAQGCANNIIAQKLFTLAHIREVYFFDNYITVTQDGEGDWDELEEKIRPIILSNIKDHNPDIVIEAPKTVEPKSANPEIEKIDAIIDQTIRPALQMDGGDIRLVNLEGNVLTVNYQGACGSCPSSAMGTLKAIESLLRDQYNPELVVELAS